jgi:hypothetical protein
MMVFPSAEQTTEHDNNGRANDGEANDRQTFADRFGVGDGDMRCWLCWFLIAGTQRHDGSGYRQKDDFPGMGPLTSEPGQGAAEHSDTKDQWNDGDHGWCGFVVVLGGNEEARRGVNRPGSSVSWRYTCCVSNTL